jgi:hypothetical protein
MSDPEPDVADTPAPDFLCPARKPYAPQEGERCSMLPHAEWMSHSWVPWSMAVSHDRRGRRALP